MRHREDGDTETIRAAHQFIARQAPLAAIVDTGVYRTLGDLLDRIERQSVEQVSEGMAGKSATQTAAAAREELIEEHMRPIASVAHWLALRHPGLKSLRMPSSYRGVTALVAHAAGMGVEASKYHPLFVEAGLPADFVERMDSAIQRFKDASAQPRQHRSNRRGVTEGAEADLKQAKKYLKVLDAFVRRTAGDDTALVAAWAAVKRFPPRRKAAVEAPELPAVAPPLMLTAPAEPLQLTGRVEESEPAKAPARWTLRNLFRT